MTAGVCNGTDEVEQKCRVNPLGGCLPALFQIPIFFALYSFFNSNIALRGHGFLWATDLSTYDSILNFGFNIRFMAPTSAFLPFRRRYQFTHFLIWYGQYAGYGESNDEIHPFIFPFFC